MGKLLRRWLKPKDPHFKLRPVAEQRFGRWLLVELGANDYVVLIDLLSRIQHSDVDSDTKGQQMVGLRYMALAMSLRTPFGRVPLDYNNQADLLWLGNQPYSQLVQPLKAIAQLSDIPWLDPDFMAEQVEEENDVELIPPTKQEIEVNPS